jgi:hypothetical protein
MDELVDGVGLAGAKPKEIEPKLALGDSLPHGPFGGEKNHLHPQEAREVG